MALSNVDLLNYITRKKLIIKPFDQKMLTGNGVDLRLGNEIARLIQTSSNDEIFNSRSENVGKWYQIEYCNDSFVVYPHERLLCHTLEYLKLPNDLIGFCQLRSTFARMGLSMPPTIISTGFEGQLTIELIGGVFPIKMYAGQKIVHVTFFKLITPSTLPYKGKYQGQIKITLPKLEEL
jgi:dCTP deaminase